MGFDDLAGDRSYRVAVRWSPPRLGDVGKKSNQAKGWASEVEADIEAAEQRLAAEVRILHMNTVFLDEQIKFAEASAEVRAQILDFIERQIGAGTKTIADRGLAELSLADARSLPSSRRLDRRLCIRNLQYKLNLPRTLDLKIQMDGDPLALPPPPDEEGLVEKALQQHHKLAAASARCTQSQAQLRLRKAGRYPWLSFVEVNRDFGWEGLPDSWGFRVGIDIPVFQWSQRMFQAPMAKVDQCRLELRAVKSRIGLEVEELVERMRAPGPVGGARADGQADARTQSGDLGAPSGHWSGRSPAAPDR